MDLFGFVHLTREEQPSKDQRQTKKNDHAGEP